MGWLDTVREVARQGLDADVGLAATMGGLVEWSAARYPVDPGARFVPGRPLSILLAGYAGNCNTGADIRVEELIRQLRWLVGDRSLSLSILTIDPDLSRSYFPTVRQIHLPQIFPAFVAEQVHRHHGVVAVEGSMFKSKFANALSILMAGALGCAVAEHKVAIGWGGEAGSMDPALRALVRRTCGDAHILCRNEASRRVLAEVGVPRTYPGTDTAWTVAPPDPEPGRALLRAAGWDGVQPILWVAPISPFGWPVKAEVGRAVWNAVTGLGEEDHYASIYFHRGGDEVAARQRRYVRGLVDGIRAFTARVPHFVAVLGMERLDRAACRAVADGLGGAPVFVSDEHRWPVMLSLLRAGRMLLSSRYHAVVCSMGGGVLSAGVTMDERLRNLFDERGTPELCLGVEDDALGDRVAQVLGSLHDRSDEIRVGVDRCVARQIVEMGRMGRQVVDILRAELPGLEIRPELGGRADPLLHLPPLAPELQRSLEVGT